MCKNSLNFTYLRSVHFPRCKLYLNRKLKTKKFFNHHSHCRPPAGLGGRWPLGRRSRGPAGCGGAGAAPRHRLRLRTGALPSPARVGTCGNQSSAGLRGPASRQPRLGKAGSGAQGERGPLSACPLRPRPVLSRGWDPPRAWAGLGSLGRGAEPPTAHTAPPRLQGGGQGWGLSPASPAVPLAPHCVERLRSWFRPARCPQWSGSLEPSPLISPLGL